jgi:hypothetical protein
MDLWRPINGLGHHVNLLVIVLPAVLLGEHLRRERPLLAVFGFDDKHDLVPALSRTRVMPVRADCRAAEWPYARHAAQRSPGGQVADADITGNIELLANSFADFLAGLTARSYE